jgi:hypothetical protein
LLIFLDYYLTIEPAQYVSPAPFTNSELEGKLPESVYTKTELLTYLQASKEKCRKLILGLTTELAQKRWINAYRNYSVLEMLIYNLRHVQHHAAKLNFLLRQQINNAPAWVAQTNIK